MTCDLCASERESRLRAERERDEARAQVAAWERAAVGAFGEGTTPANLLEGGQGMEQALHDSETDLAAAQKRIEGLEAALREDRTALFNAHQILKADGREEWATAAYRAGVATDAALSSPAVTAEGKKLGEEGGGR